MTFTLCHESFLCLFTSWFTFCLFFLLTTSLLLRQDISQPIASFSFCSLILIFPHHPLHSSFHPLSPSLLLGAKSRKLPASFSRCRREGRQGWWVGAKQQRGGLCSQIDLCRVHQTDEPGQRPAQAQRYAWHPHLSCIGLHVYACQNAVLAPVPTLSLFTQHLGLGEKHRHKMAATVIALFFQWVKKEEVLFSNVLWMRCENDEWDNASLRECFLCALCLVVSFSRIMVSEPWNGH